MYLIQLRAFENGAVFYTIGFSYDKHFKPLVNSPAAKACFFPGLITTCNLSSYGFNRAANIILLRTYRQTFYSAYALSTSTALSTVSQHVCEIASECGYVTFINNAFLYIIS